MVIVSNCISLQLRKNKYLLYKVTFGHCPEDTGPTVSQRTQYPSLARISILFPLVSQGIFWLFGSVIQGIFLEILNPAAIFFGGFSPALLLGGPTAHQTPPVIFCHEGVFIFTHTVPIPATIRGHRGAVSSKCRARQCCFGKLQWSLVLFE